MICASEDCKKLAKYYTTLNGVTYVVCPACKFQITLNGYTNPFTKIRAR